jgi:hypothetical protein
MNPVSHAPVVRHVNISGIVGCPTGTTSAPIRAECTSHIEKNDCHRGCLQLTRLSIISILNAVYPDADFAGLHEISDPRVRGLLRLCEACQHGDERDGENQLCHRRLIPICTASERRR